MKQRIAKRQRPRITPETAETWRTCRRHEATRDAHRGKACCPGAPPGASVFRCVKCEEYFEAESAVIVALAVRPWEELTAEQIAQLDEAIAA